MPLFERTRSSSLPSQSERTCKLVDTVLLPRSTVETNSRQTPDRNQRHVSRLAKNEVEELKSFRTSIQGKNAFTVIDSFDSEEMNPDGNTSNTKWAEKSWIDPVSVDTVNSFLL